MSSRTRQTRLTVPLNLPAPPNNPFLNYNCDIIKTSSSVVLWRSSSVAPYRHLSSSALNPQGPRPTPRAQISQPFCHVCLKRFDNAPPSPRPCVTKAQPTSSPFLVRHQLPGMLNCSETQELFIRLLSDGFPLVNSRRPLLAERRRSHKTPSRVFLVQYHAVW